jgi:hypothetical protein
MFPFNEKYRRAMKRQIHRYAISGTIGNKNFTDADFSKFTITNRIADDNTVSIGSVYMAELHITFLKSLGISWVNTLGWEIYIAEGLWVDPIDGFTYVPAGHYFIQEVKNTKEGIEVTAYDAMSKFDKTPRNLATKNRTLPALLEDICEACGVDLVSIDFTQFPNSSTVFTLASENDCETYRDILSWIALTMGSYATINRFGFLDLRMYTSTAYDPADFIDEDARADSYAFNDYYTRYTGLYATDSERKATKYFHVEPDDGLTYNIGTNPFIQGVTEQKFKQVCEAILGGIQNIDYVPFSIDTLPTAVYDLGDVIQFSGGAGGGKQGCIMLYDYTYNQESHFEGLGQNPALADAKSKTDKNISRILSQVDAAKEYMYSFTNDSDVVLTQNWRTILTQRFGTATATWAMFQAEILCDDPDGSVVEVRYLLDNEVISRYPIETWIEGKHILSLMYPITTDEGNFYNWAVQLRSDGGAVEIKQGDAIGIIKGQGLVSSDVWNGYIDVSDEYTIMSTLEDSDLLTYTETTVTAVTQLPTSESITEDFDLLDSVDDSGVKHYVDVYAFNQDFLNQLTWDEAALHTWDYTEINYVWGIDLE